MMFDYQFYSAIGADITELEFSELEFVDGGVNWYAVGRVVGTAARLGAVAGGAGALAAAGVVGGALLIDYALDGKLDLID